MPRVSLEIRRRIVSISKSGYSVLNIQNCLAEEKIYMYTSKVSIYMYKILKEYQQHGDITGLFRGSHTPKLSSEQLMFIENTMAGNDELTENRCVNSCA